MPHIDVTSKYSLNVIFALWLIFYNLSHGWSKTNSNALEEQKLFKLFMKIVDLRIMKWKIVNFCSGRRKFLNNFWKTIKFTWKAFFGVGFSSGGITATFLFIGTNERHDNLRGKRYKKISVNFWKK